MCSEHLESFGFQQTFLGAREGFHDEAQKDAKNIFRVGKECLGKLITHLLCSKATAALKPGLALKVYPFLRLKHLTLLLEQHFLGNLCL